MVTFLLSSNDAVGVFFLFGQVPPVRRRRVASSGIWNRGGAGGEWKRFFAGLAEDHEAGLPVVRVEADPLPLCSQIIACIFSVPSPLPMLVPCDTPQLSADEVGHRGETLVVRRHRVRHV